MMIQEKEIAKMMALLHCGREEAIDVIEYDKAVDRSKPSDEPLAHDLPKEIEKQALKDAHKGTDKKSPNYTFTKRERKPNESKREIIEALRRAVEEISGSEAVTVANIEREITFALDGVDYSVTLTAHRAKKK